jgi:cyclically-permuted mutarotase family protein
MVILNSCIFNISERISLKSLTLPAIPPALGDSVQPGLAGPVAGAHGNFVLVAGGANFENGLPWRGGKKVYHEEIYLMEKSASGDFVWKQSTEKLPFSMAYPVCVSTPEGVLSIGGEDQNGLVNHFFLFSFQDGGIKTEALAELPQAISSAGAAIVGSNVFVVGGLTSKGATSSFYTINLQKKTNGWRVLPELPLALSHAVVASQNDGEEDCIYVIGGRNRTGEISTFYSSVWKYKPSGQKWISEGDILSEGKKLGLSAGTGVAAGSEHILLFGGDPGIFFNRTERLNNAIEKASGEEEKQRLWKEKDEMLSDHPGFSKDILSFNTRSKKWEKIGNLTGESPATTNAFLWNETVVIPSGEVRPGVRTPNVLGIKIEVSR